MIITYIKLDLTASNGWPQTMHVSMHGACMYVSTCCYTNNGKFTWKYVLCARVAATGNITCNACNFLCHICISHFHCTAKRKKYHRKFQVVDSDACDMTCLVTLLTS